MNDHTANKKNFFFRYTNSDHIDYVSSLAWNPTNQNELLSASWDGCVKTHEINVRK
jgi:hypothetical protein